MRQSELQRMSPEKAGEVADLSRNDSGTTHVKVCGTNKAGHKYHPLRKLAALRVKALLEKLTLISGKAQAWVIARQAAFERAAVTTKRESALEVWAVR